MQIFSRWLLVVLLILSLTVRPANAGWGWSVSIGEWGPLEATFEAGLKIGLKNSLVGRIFLVLEYSLMAVAIFQEVMEIDAFVYDSDTSKALHVSPETHIQEKTHGRGAEPAPVAKTVVLVRSDNVMPGDVFRIKFYDLVLGNRMELGEGAYLIVEDDGKLRFHNYGFDGWYMYYHYNKSLSIFDEQDKLIMMVRLFKDERLEIARKQCEAADRFLTKILGGVS